MAVPLPTADTTENECLCCGAFVTQKFCRVYGDEQNRVHRCRNCDTDARLRRGSATGNDIAYPDPRETTGRKGGEVGEL